MVFKKFLGKEKAPKNMGEAEPEHSNQLVNRYYLEFPKLNGEPTFLLEDTLTVGSEEASVLIDEDGISPSHFSVNLHNDVISIVDHGSAEGTYVNKKRIPAGKMIILGPKDKLKAGNIEFKVVEREEVVPLAAPQTMTIPKSVREEAPGSPDEAPTEMVAPRDATSEMEAAPALADITEADNTQDIPVAPSLDEEEDAEEIYVESEPEDIDPEDEPVSAERNEYKKQTKNQTKNKEFKVKGKGSVKDSANGFLRVLGLICDVLIIGVIHNLASGEPAYDQFLRDLPAMVGDVLGPLYNQYLAPEILKLYQAVPSVGKAQEFVLSFYKNEHAVFLELALLVAFFRLVSSFVLGASLGQCLVGIRAEGNPLLKRLLAPLRFVFGALLLPLFWVFDFPTLFSKRSLKEVLSFTHLRTPSNIVAILSLIFFIPVLSLGLLTAPVWKGMEIPKPIPFSPMKKVELAVFDETPIDSYSEYFRAGIPGTRTAYFLPQFKFAQRSGKKTLEPSFVLGMNGKSSVQIKMLKKVSLVEMLRSFAKANPLAELKYPEISALVHDAANTSKHFKDLNFPALRVSADLQKLLVWSLDMVRLDPDFALNFLKENGPFIGGFIEFRKSLLAAMGEGVKGFELKQVGNAIQIVGDYSNGRKVIKRVLPINSKQTRLYEISHEKGQDGTIAEMIAYNVEMNLGDADPLVAFVDSLTPEADRENILDIFQAANQAYYNLAKTALVENHQKLYSELQKSLQGSLGVLENANALKIPVKAGEKLTQNLNDILKALNEKDLSYFGIRAVGAI